jgi:hypothetical protein
MAPACRLPPKNGTLDTSAQCYVEIRELKTVSVHTMYATSPLALQFLRFQSFLIVLTSLQLNYLLGMIRNAFILSLDLLLGKLFPTLLPSCVTCSRFFGASYAGNALLIIVPHYLTEFFSSRASRARVRNTGRDSHDAAEVRRM